MNTKYLKIGSVIGSISGIGYYLYKKFNIDSSPDSCPTCGELLQSVTEKVFISCKDCYQKKNTVSTRDILLDKVCENGVVDIILNYKIMLHAND